MSNLRTSFESLLQRYGFNAQLLRHVGTGAKVSVTVRVMRRYAEEQTLWQEVSQDSTWFAVRRRELEEADFDLPIKKGDQLLDDGVYYTVYVAEPMRDGPNVIGYRCRTIGT